MKRVTRKIYGKINFTLDVGGLQPNGYHEIDSLVASIGLVDAITLSKRDDDRIYLAEEGFRSGVPAAQNNAVKAARAFMARYHTAGVNIYLEKNIPVGGGFGSSSADIAGVVLGMKRLFKIKENIEPLLASLGSDTVYQAEGGMQIIYGKGDKKERVKARRAFPVLLIAGERPIGAAECYRKFDELKQTRRDCTSRATYFLEKGELDSFYLEAKNDLLHAALTFIPEIQTDIAILKDYGAVMAGMSGSGSGVYGVFENGFACDRAYRKLEPLFRDRLFKTMAF